MMNVDHFPNGFQRFGFPHLNRHYFQAMNINGLMDWCFGHTLGVSRIAQQEDDRIFVQRIGGDLTCKTGNFHGWFGPELDHLGDARNTSRFLTGWT